MSPSLSSFQRARLPHVFHQPALNPASFGSVANGKANSISESVGHTAHLPGADGSSASTEHAPEEGLQSAHMNHLASQPLLPLMWMAELIHLTVSMKLVQSLTSSNGHVLM